MLLKTSCGPLKKPQHHASFKNPEDRYKLEMIKSIRAQRAASDPKISEAILRATLIRNEYWCSAAAVPFNDLLNRAVHGTYFGHIEFMLPLHLSLSSDMAHGVHPNFMDKHKEHRRPKLHKVLVIKHNAKQRYATSGITAFCFKEVAKIHKLPTQDFVVRNDMGCGSTIGPILAFGIGIRAVDCGIPQLSRHKS
uniref:aspartyl aminopeptidase n=1 Tax=Tanacetum cinerariifolium TaxID=118510 RepID=A0A6L2KNB5_TANCI|nr:probable aspartyl aminopeptidase isoform X2 [Tanacetum cinerariifolium]